MTTPPLQGVSGLLRAMLLDESDRRPRRGERNSLPDAPAMPRAHSLREEISQLTLGVNAGNSTQVENAKRAVVDAILRHELGDCYAEAADRAQVVDAIASAVSSVTGAQTWTNLIAHVQAEK